VDNCRQAGLTAFRQIPNLLCETLRKKNLSTLFDEDQRCRRRISTRSSSQIVAFMHQHPPRQHWRSAALHYLIPLRCPPAAIFFWWNPKNPSFAHYGKPFAP